MEINRSLDPNRTLVRVRSVLIHRTREPHTSKSTATTRRHPLALSLKLTEMSGGDSIARQRAFIGNSLNDEQWSDDLSNPPSC